MSVQWRWVRALVDALVAGGVRDAILSPGSRSTPIVLALASDPRVRCESILDERSAAFFALGQARVNDRPSLLVCTSGSAAAHYLPAVIEAAAASIPLLVLSADRPFALQHCGANQTIDQTKLFGSFVRHFADLGEGTDDPSAIFAVRRAAVQAVAATRHPLPGPVHLNVHLRKPLEPTPELLREPAVEPAPLRIHVPRMLPAPDAVDELEAAIRGSERPLLVAGPSPLSMRVGRDAVFAWARRAGVPLAAEATSQLRFRGDPAPSGPMLDHFEALYRSEIGRTTLRPDLVIQLGAAPSSSAFERLFEGAHAPARVVVDPHGPSDPPSAARAWVMADVAETFRALDDRFTAKPYAAPSWWGHALEEAERAIASCATDELARSGTNLTEAMVARTVVARLPSSARLALGNSLAVRQVDLWAPGSSADVGVLSQRGASGIDGLISGAAGSAQASEAPLVLLVGDVSFLHDVGGLLVAARARTPLVVVVVQNDGGRIFEQLPLGSRSDLAPAFPHFTTPHGLSFAPAAALFGTAYARVTDTPSLAAAITDAVGRPGCTIVEAIVPPSFAAEQNARLFADAERSLARISLARPR